MDAHCNAAASNHATIAARIKGDLSKKRRGMPKTRTGCRTCRQRHIKCDERKPVCLRCEKLGVQCQGLGYSGSGSGSVRACAGPVCLQRSESRLSRSLAGGLPFNELDMRYFQLFQAHSTTDLSGYFQSDFWGRLILQQGQCEPSIKDAIVAIGALYKSIEIARKSPPGLEAGPNQLVHFKSAIQHYQKAVRSQRRSLEVGDLQWRTSLISCLLFVCFEALQGDHYSVWQQIFCGLHLLLGHGRPLNSSQPACADRMDEELSQIFSRLEIHIRIYDDVRPEQYILPNLSMKLHYTGIRDSLSKLQSEKHLHPFIESVEEARYTWDILFPKVLDVRHRTEPYRFFSKKDVPPEVFMEVKKQIEDLLLWKAAFQPLFQKTWNNTNDRNRPGASVLYINYMFGYLKIATCFELSEMVYDSFLWEFQETVRVSRYLLESEFLPPHQKPTFLLDSVVLNPLFFTALKCRDRILRREANALLKSSDRREGMWDLKMLSCIIDWMISNEEEGLEPDAPIQECNRFRMLNLKCNIHQRMGWAKCGRHVDGVEDYVDVREVTFNY